MTGIERLRAMGREYFSCSRERPTIDVMPYGVSVLLADIADQIEREQRRDPAADVSVSAYDLLPQEDREAIAWVREHGGIEVLRRMFQDADSRRVELCAALGIDLDKGWSEAMAAMRLRLMPEGTEWLLEVWPKWSNGEYCKFGDWWVSDNYGEPKPKQFRKLSIYTPEQLDEWGQGDGESYGYEWDFVRPSDPKYRPDKVEPPAPKVLDADGVEIREKRDVWWICEGDERGVHAERLRVETICPNGLIECSPYNGGTWVYLEPSELYVNKPVPASDGKPLREGETVYGIGWTKHRFVVRAASDYEEDEPDGRFCVPCIDKDDGDEECWCDPSQLTHERPDSWERLEADANAAVCIYFGASVKDCENCDHNSWECSYDKSRDLVRRARALAGDAS